MTLNVYLEWKIDKQIHLHHLQNNKDGKGCQQKRI